MPRISSYLVMFLKKMMPNSVIGYYPSVDYSIMTEFKNGKDMFQSPR